eukprot:TRINITY_DN36672_c0_g2_i1.p1 TRINITY_DN36672_c0_g2~~TRINITY_DN36672_c0_g2_i1.p1  ORF type:complete len:103 (+),score=13.31 TRINITY_DN36672_c0_g2_i1:101-409(+)
MSLDIRDTLKEGMMNSCWSTGIKFSKGGNLIDMFSHFHEAHPSPSLFPSISSSSALWHLLSSSATFFHAGTNCSEPKTFENNESTKPSPKLFDSNATRFGGG